ncbi:MAG: alpha-L-fucosidase [bacterium]
MKQPTVYLERKIPLAFLLALIFSTAAPAQEDSAEGPPSGFLLKCDVPYGTQSEAQRLDILYPTDSSQPLPAIIMIHGGGWYTGGKGGDRTRGMMCAFANAGYVALSIDYRLSDEARFPATVEDCKLAVRWLRANAEEYRVDSEKIGAIGASAGGHLSAMLAVTTPEDGLEGHGGYEDLSSAIQASVPVCPPCDLRIPLSQKLADQDDPVVIRFLGGPLSEKTEAARRASPISYVRADLPPTLIVHGTADKRVNMSQSIAMANALKDAGAPYELIQVKDGEHGMGIVRREDIFARVLAFFDETLKEGSEDASGQTASPEDLEWWLNAKFGLFIHWGPVSLKGEEISWSRGGERRGLPGLLPGKIPVSEYDRLYLEFNPVKFDAAEWVDIAKEAGMKYLVFTTKHHDGFCMFDSQLTDYKITRSPYKKDIVAQLAKACHEGGLGLGFYYSLPDWYHPDYRTGQHERYVEYMHGQLRELCTKYGQVDVIWFDGKNQGTPESRQSYRLISMIRSLQPHVLINNRSGGPADFETPEQVIGRFQPNEPWESCITLGHQWAWKPDDLIKPAAECIVLLVRCVGGGGNMLLNVGPTATGEIEPRQVERLKEIGAWLRQYGDSIYGTRGGPFAPSYWGASTHKGNKIYVHIFEGWESALELPPIEREIMSSRLLNGGAVKVAQSPEGVTIDVPSTDCQPPDTIVELTLDGPAKDVSPKSAGIGMPEGVTARASNVRRREEGYAPGKAVDESPMSRWATDDGITQAWLEFHLPAPVTFDVIMMDEAFGPRVQEFRIQAKDGDEWRTFYTGTTMGRNWAGKLKPVTAQDIRVDILEASDGPTIRDIQFHFVEGDD